MLCQIVLNCVMKSLQKCQRSFSPTLAIPATDLVKVKKTVLRMLKHRVVERQGLECLVSKRPSAWQLYARFGILRIQPISAIPCVLKHTRTDVRHSLCTRDGIELSSKTVF